MIFEDLQRTITGHQQTVGERLEMERRVLNTLPRERHDTSEEALPRVDSKALATVRTNRYSVPAALAGLRVAARVGANDIAFWHDGREVARHERLAGKHQTSAQLDHYLDLLARKPGALARSLRSWIVCATRSLPHSTVTTRSCARRASSRPA
jgi:hypothetical protein